MFCTKCGNQIKDGFKFCPKCGTPVYVEKEKAENEVKAQVEEDVKKETSKKESEAKKDVDARAKSQSTTSSKKSSDSSSFKQKYIPNPFMAKELDIEGVKKRAEQGDRYAMSLQCYRCEMGIGTEIDMVKFNELKDLGAASLDEEWISLFYYSKELETPYIATKKG